MGQVNTKGSGFLDRKTINANNKTGSALVKGGVYALDLTHVDSGSTDGDSALAAVVACATANLRGILVVATDTTAAAADGLFVLKGRVNALVDGTTDVAAGDRLIPQNASANLIKQGTTSLVNPAGFALAAQTTDAGTLTDIYFDGETWKGEKAAS